MTAYPADSHVVPLDPCPHCGAPAEFVEHDPCLGYGSHELGWWAHCTSCSAQMGNSDDLFMSRLDLVAEWNRRASPDEIAALVAEADAKAAADYEAARPEIEAQVAERRRLLGWDKDDEPT